MGDDELRDQGVDDELADVLGATLAFAGQGLSYLGQRVGRAEAHDPAQGAVMLMALLSRSVPAW